MKVLRNLGRRFEDSKMISGYSVPAGYEVLYNGGDTCDEDKSKKYSTRIKYHCDHKQEEYNMPIVELLSPCNFQISWYSKLACPICSTVNDLDRISSMCD